MIDNKDKPEETSDETLKNKETDVEEIKPLKNKRFSNFKTKYNQSDFPAKFALIGWWTLLAGIVAATSLSGGFGMYALLLMIIGLLTCILCPCIGGAIIGGTAAIWTTLVMINIYIGIACLGIMGVTSIIGLIASINRVKTSVVVQLAVQLIIAIVGLYFLYPLIDLLL